MFGSLKPPGSDTDGPVGGSMRFHLALLLVAACHSPVETPSVAVSPEEPDTRDDLVATATAAEGLTVTYQWFRDEEAVTELRGPRVPASLTTRGETWRVDVHATDGRESVLTSASVVIRNARPGVVVEVAPSVPAGGDAIAAAVVATDADHDALVISREWLRDGAVTGFTGDHVPQNVTRRGEVWTVRAWASDGIEQGPAVSAEVTVVNAVPEVLEGWLAPAAPRTGDVIQVEVDVEDGDGDGYTVDYAWRVGDQVVQEGELAYLAPKYFDKGDLVSVVVTPSDAWAEGRAFVVGPVTIANTPPGAPSALVVSEPALSRQPLQCLVDVPAEDVDGDAIVGYVASWLVDGEPFEGEATDFEGDTVPAGVTRGGERWTCQLRASDGADLGEVGEASVDVAWDGFHASQTVAGAELTCASVVDTDTYTECIGLKVGGLALPNGVGCATGWVRTASPYTDHADLCARISGSRGFQATYGCDSIQSRATWSGGVWGTRSDNGFTGGLRCEW